jgi:hypothetical protein
MIVTGDPAMDRFIRAYIWTAAGLLVIAVIFSIIGHR